MPKKRVSAARHLKTATGRSQETVKTTDMDERIGEVFCRDGEWGVHFDILLDSDLPKPGNIQSAPHSKPQGQLTRSDGTYRLN